MYILLRRNWLFGSYPYGFAVIKFPTLKGPKVLCGFPLAWINEHDNCYGILITFSALGMGNSKRTC